MQQLQLALAGLLIATLAMVLAAWVGFELRRRIAFLEHEVRWLRSELDTLKKQRFG
jgi:uncharacterized small protein (DUF1192 family)